MDRGRWNRALRWFVGFVVAAALLTADQQPVTADAECFAATGYCLRGRFLDYWREHGGLAINGYPLTEERGERLEDGEVYRVQYFERVRLEYHPENAPPHDILLGQFGRLLHPADPPVPPQPGRQHFPETGHNVPPDFLAFWQAKGGLAQFGYPLSEVFRETLEDGKQYEVQYFERARFERHPEFSPPYNLQLGQFGRQILAIVPPSLTPETIGSAVETGHWGKGWPAAMAFSPDGRWLAVTSSAGLILYDAHTLTVRQALRQKGTRAIAFSPDSQRIVIGRDHAPLEVRRVADLGLAFRLSDEAINDGSQTIRFSPDGGLLAISTGVEAHLHRASDGQRQQSFSGHTEPITSIAFSPDGTTLVTADSGTESHSLTIKRWRVATGALLTSAMLPGQYPDIHQLGLISADGGLIATKGQSRIAIWRLDDDSLIHLSDLPDDVRAAFGALVFAKSGSEVVIGTTTGATQRWRVADGSPIATIQQGSSGIEFLGLGPDEASGATLSSDGVLRIFRVADGATIGTASEYTIGQPLAVSPDGATLVSAVRSSDQQGALALRQLANGNLDRTIVIDGRPRVVAYSPDGQLLASSGWSGAIQLWRVSDGALIRTLGVRGYEAEQLRFSPDGRYLATVRSPQVQVWRISDGAVLHTFFFESRHGSVVFSPDSAFLAFADEGRVQKRRLADGALVGEFVTGTDHYGDGLTLSPDGSMLITNDAPEALTVSTVQCWEWETHRRLYALSTKDRILSVAVAPAGTLVALGGGDDTVLFIDARTGRIVRTISAVHSRASLVSFSPDGTALVFATFDGTIRLWGLPR